MIKAPGNDIEPPSDELRIQYRVFVQSRSPGNRHLRAGTLLLYKVNHYSIILPSPRLHEHYLCHTSLDY